MKFTPLIILLLKPQALERLSNMKTISNLVLLGSFLISNIVFAGPAIVVGGGPRGYSSSNDLTQMREIGMGQNLIKNGSLNTLPSAGVRGRYNLPNMEINGLPQVKFVGKEHSEIVFDIAVPGQADVRRLNQRPEEFTGANTQVLEALKKSAAVKEWVDVQQAMDLYKMNSQQGN